MKHVGHSSSCHCNVRSLSTKLLYCVKAQSKWPLSCDLSLCLQPLLCSVCHNRQTDTLLLCTQQAPQHLACHRQCCLLYSSGCLLAPLLLLWWRLPGGSSSFALPGCCLPGRGAAHICCSSPVLLLHIQVLAHSNPHCASAFGNRFRTQVGKPSAVEGHSRLGSEDAVM